MNSISASESNVTALAERYVKLVLALGELDKDYVDAYYGPAEWRDEVKKEKKTLDQLGTEAAALSTSFTNINQSNLSADELRRLKFTSRQLGALQARIEMLKGKKLHFDQESNALYDASAPIYNQEDFRPILKQLDSILPGHGELHARYEAFKKNFIIPKEKLDAIFQAAVQECKSQTEKHVKLPPNESFTIEYVQGKSWSGYNWYQGNYRSIIQVNTDLPITFDRAIDLACHEGYPGHHVFNTLIEKNLVRDRGWIEFSVYPLFSPLSLIAEGTANYGIDVTFPGNERSTYEKEKLFPLAGLDPKSADSYYKVLSLVDKLDHAGNVAARKYLNGEITSEQAVKILEEYALMLPEIAKRRLRFFDQYRSYSINYNLGQDLVRNYIESRSAGDSEKRWKEFEMLLSFPRLPSELIQK